MAKADCTSCGRTTAKPNELGRCPECHTIIETNTLFVNADRADYWDILELYADDLKRAFMVIRHYEKRPPEFGYHEELKTWFDKRINEDDKRHRISGGLFNEPSNVVEEQPEQKPEPETRARPSKPERGFGKAKTVALRTDARSQLNACRFQAQDATNLAVDLLLGHSVNFTLLVETLEQALDAAKKAQAEAAAG